MVLLAEGKGREMYLSREEILGVQGVKVIEVPVPEWGGTVLVRELSAAEVTQIGMGLVAISAAEVGLDNGRTARVVQVESMAAHFPRIVAQCVVNNATDLEPILTLRDVHAFSADSSEPLQRIAVAALKLSGLYEETEEGKEGVDAEAIEEAVVEELDPNA